MYIIGAILAFIITVILITVFVLKENNGYFEMEPEEVLGAIVVTMLTTLMSWISIGTTILVGMTYLIFNWYNKRQLKKQEQKDK